MRIVIGEDSALFREGLARLLADAGHEIVAKAGDADALEAAVHEAQPDVAVIDIRMPPDNDDDGARVRAASPRPTTRTSASCCSRSTSRPATRSSSSPAAASATCSRTASSTSTTSSTRCSASPPAARRSTPRSSDGCSDRARTTARWRSSPPASARCSR